MNTHAVENDVSGIPEKVMDVSEEESPWDSLDVDGIKPFGGMPCICSTYGTGERQQGRGKAEGR